MATYNKETFKRLFQSKFNLSKWQMLLQDYFHADKVRVSPEVLDEDAEDRKGYFLGSMTTQDNYELGFFYYEMEDGSVLRRKVGLRNLIRPYLGYGFDAALAVFNDGTNWRLSLICDLKEDATSTKRFTYVFGDEKAFYKTPILRFESLRTKANEFLEIKKAFSVEALSDDFFDEYRKQYAEFVKFLTGKEYVKKGNKWVEQETEEPDAQYFTSFKEDDKLVRDYIKKMMGRIVFLYFLQSKGWLAGNLHYMHDLFYDASDEVKENFLDKVLEPMFFGLLNTKPEDRNSAPMVNGVGVKYIPNADEIPYLNGGLFQQEKIDEVDSVFPAGMFQSLFDFFDSYNFTIDENDPNDAEVGVDPEMLGKIFENLLEDNKDKGAFYTPKEIVRYMCQESLTAYLQTGIENAEVKKHIANFVKTNDVEELGGASSELAMSIDQKLIDVKICDPAIGSGAFPMGLLRELYACRKSIEIFEEDNAADIKRHIIQNNIYGVDIEKGAVDIARLRFWLALIIDEKEPMPLPNLDFKIMQGNSLLESYKGVDLDVTSKKLKTGKDTKKTRGVLSLGFEETDVQKTIQDLVKSYFSITDHTLRAQRRQQIDKYVKDYIKICAEGNHEVQDAVDELEIPNDQFFLWHTYFADVFEKGGFDIVIANPPYVLVQTIKDKALQKYYKDSFEVSSYKIDLYHLFIEKGFDMLKKEGSLIYINPSNFLTNNYTISLRDYLLQQNSLCSIINIEDDVFAASVNTCVFLGRNISPNSNSVLNYYKGNVKQGVLELQLLSQDLQLNYLKVFGHIIQPKGTDDVQMILSKISSASILLKQCATIKFGMQLRNRKIYPMDVVKNPNNESLTSWHRKCLTGKDIHPYCANYSGLYCYYNVEAKCGGCWDETIHNQEVKVLVRQVGAVPICGIDTNGYAILNSAFMIVSDAVSPFYLLALLNSTLLRFYWKNVFEDKRKTFPKIKGSYLEQMPMVIGNTDKVVQLAKKINEKKRNEQDDACQHELQTIDFLVYHLYGLTYDEVLIVDPETPISREEYEAYNIEQ